MIRLAYVRCTSSAFAKDVIDSTVRLLSISNHYLVVTPNGSKLWRFDYRYGEKRRTLALVKWDDVELAQARERRDAARKQLAEDRELACLGTRGR
jgi:hypothetical protein